MPMFDRLPTTLWMAAAAAAVTCLSPVVGQVVTEPPTPARVQVQGTPAPAPVASPSLSTPPATSDSQTPPVETDPEPVTVAAGSTKLGPTAVDADGFTLYLSDLDKTDPPRSVCLSDVCLSAWKPVSIPDGQGPRAGEGIGRGAVGVVDRPDGIRQVTLGGWPLYRYTQDTKPGDVKGEGLKGIWHAISPSGTKATAR